MQICGLPSMIVHLYLGCRKLHNNKKEGIKICLWVISVENQYADFKDSIAFTHSISEGNANFSIANLWQRNFKNCWLGDMWDKQDAYCLITWNCFLMDTILYPNKSNQYVEYTEYIVVDIMSHKISKKTMA